MENSSQNPYIPQESEALRQKVYQQQSPLGRAVKWSLIASIVVAILVGIGLFFVIPRTTAVDEKARVQLADTLQPPDQMLKRVPVRSDLGFTLNYDNRVYSSYAEVGDSTSGTDGSSAVLRGETYENNELRVAREYNYVRIRPVESVEASRALQTQPPELEIFATATDKELVDVGANAENRGLSKLSLFVKLETDKRLAERARDDKTVVTIEAAKPVASSVNGTDYQKVRFTTTNDNYRVTNVRYDDCYYTIKNEQPYAICISNVRPANISAASLVERVFDTVSFEQSTAQSDDKTSYALPLARLAQATTSTDSTDETDAEADTESDATSTPGEAPLITVAPQYYTDADSLSAIAKNQPSVVRIGTLYCANLALKIEGGETVTTLSDACVGSVASGAFVSSDGYVATTGHAIRFNKKQAITGYINFAPDQNQMLERLQRVLDYLLKAKKILQSDADYIKTGASIGDQEALAKVENIASVIPDNFITPVSETYTYAVQPTDKPIVINRTDTNKPTFAYSDSVLQAKYVASSYDTARSLQYEFQSTSPKSDAGLLKVEGTFPHITVAGNTDSKANDTLNTIGYSAYTDSSLTIDRIRNMPVVTTSKVEQAYEKDGGQLIQTNLPVLPGNDGAPVMDSHGNLVGLAVYGLSYCPDQLCFADGTIRSASELQTLLDENNITLNTNSESKRAWGQATDEYIAANYAASASSFTAAGGQYAFNRWAEPLSKLASGLKGSEKDTSLMNQLRTVMIVVLIVLVVVTILLAILYALHRRRLSFLQVGHYGAQDTTQPIAPYSTQAPVVPAQPQLPPVQSQDAQAPYAPEPAKQQQWPQQQAAPVNPQQPPVPNTATEQSFGQQTPSAYPPTAPGQPAQPPRPMHGPPEDPFYK